MNKSYIKQYFRMNGKKFLSFALVIGALLTAQPTLAKGGAPKTVSEFPTPTITSGPCNLENPNNEIGYVTPLGTEWDTELVHPDYPGGVLAHVVANSLTRSLYLTNVCLDEGWTISKYDTTGMWSTDGGFVLTVAYNGTDATRIKYVFGGYRMDQF